MKHGFIKTAAYAPDLQVADCTYNAAQILGAVKEAVQNAVKILVLPELCITGATCGDLFAQEMVLCGTERAIAFLLEETKAWDILFFLGTPLRNRGKLYNCVIAVHKGVILGVVPKTALQMSRNFVPAPSGEDEISLLGKKYPFGRNLLFQCETMPNVKIAVETSENATILVHPSARAEIIGSEKQRRLLVESESARLHCASIYADAGMGESTTDMVFSGHHLIAENGTILAENLPFADGMAITEIDVNRLAPTQPEKGQIIPFSFVIEETKLTRPVATKPFIPSDPIERDKRCEKILTIQAYGLKKRLVHSRSKTAVIGISGGLDSCLALLVAVKAVDLLQRSRETILAVTMPCFGTTSRTKSNAEQLCEHLGIELRCIPIADSVNQHFVDIGQDKTNYDVVFENAQARERTQILMDIANQTNGLVVGTGDLSELALGWATYNGDHMSMYGVNASVPKTLVRHVVQYYADSVATINPTLCAVLYDILATPISPELLPSQEDEIAQKTEDIVGPYELHDFYLYYIVHFGFLPEKIYRLACYAFEETYSKETILKWLKNFYRRFFNQQFKRSCMPDGAKVGSIGLSPRGDWAMPSDAVSALWLEEVERLERDTRKINA